MKLDPVCSLSGLKSFSEPLLVLYVPPQGRYVALWAGGLQDWLHPRADRTWQGEKGLCQGLLCSEKLQPFVIEQRIQVRAECGSLHVEAVAEVSGNVCAP